jgi:FkbM family methyltransferase
LFDLYETPERRLCQKFLLPEDDVLELGGCLGIVSCKAASKLGPRQRHVIVEANPTLIPIISTNLRRNGFHSQIVHAAIGAGDRVTFNAATHVIDSETSGEVRNERSVVVETVSASALEEKYGTFSVLVCDI